MLHVAHPGIPAIVRPRSLRLARLRPTAAIAAPLTLAAVVVLTLVLAVIAALVCALPA